MNLSKSEIKEHQIQESSQSPMLSKICIDPSSLEWSLKILS